MRLARCGLWGLGVARREGLEARLRRSCVGSPLGFRREQRSPPNAGCRCKDRTAMQPRCRRLLLAPLATQAAPRTALSPSARPCPGLATRDCITNSAPQCDTCTAPACGATRRHAGLSQLHTWHGRPAAQGRCRGSTQRGRQAGLNLHRPPCPAAQRLRQVAVADRGGPCMAAGRVSAAGGASRRGVPAPGACSLARSLARAKKQPGKLSGGQCIYLAAAAAGAAGGAAGGPWRCGAVVVPWRRAPAAGAASGRAVTAAGGCAPAAAAAAGTADTAGRGCGSAGGRAGHAAQQGVAGQRRCQWK